MKKTFAILGTICTFISIVFTIIFIWTLDATTHYSSNGFGLNRYVIDITYTEEYFQVVWAIFALIFVTVGTVFKIISICIKEKTIKQN